jgi:hypothetical protein
MTNEYEKKHPTNDTRMRRAEYFRKYKFNRQSDKTHCEYILEYLELFDSITALEAVRAFDCFRLAARISDLRQDGCYIETEYNPKGKRYAMYSLPEGGGNDQDCNS